MKNTLNKSGFTLMEIMIALGILAVGLALVSTAFPSAMIENKESVEKTMSTLISENALAICRIRLSHTSIKDSVGNALSDENNLDLIPDAEQIYPIDSDSRYGWLLAIKQYNDNNDYLLVIVPYRKLLPDDQPPVFQTVTTDGSKITSGNIYIGSPVISKNDGSYATVVDSEGNLSVNITSGNAYIVAGRDNSGTIRTDVDSPAIGCYVARTNILP